MGLDLSLNSTGYAFCEDGKLVTGRITCQSFRGPRRLSYVKDKVAAYLERVAPDLVAMEGYSMGRRGQRGNTFDTAELGGVIKTLVWERGVPHMLIPPTTMKSIIALSGAAKDKSLISAALLTHYGYTVAQNDEADATGLMIVGELKSGARSYPIQGKDRKRLESLDKLHIVKGR